MLTSLTIRNVALIESLTIEFQKGLNILSGETGAGKSIIIDSLGFVLGGKADKGMIRSGETACCVTAEFFLEENALALNVLDEMEIEREQTIILTRTLEISGRGKCTVNGVAVTPNMLKNLTSKLCDIHGQSEHHSLMKVSSHIELLDKFGGEAVGALQNRTAKDYREWKEVLKQLSEFGGDDETRERMADLLKYQIDEIEEADIKENELETLEARRMKLIHMEKLLGAIKSAETLLNGGIGESALDIVSEALVGLKSVVSYDESVSALAERLESLKYDLADIASEVSELLNGYDEDVADERVLDRIESRIEKIKSIYKKYGKDNNEVIRFLEKAQADYEKLTKSEELIAKYNARLKECETKLYESCNLLSQERRLAAAAFEKGITKELSDLGLSKAVFEVRFAETPEIGEIGGRATANGFDSVEFYMSANPGQPLRPLAKVISGGEASRFMLALKTLTSDIDRIPVMIFDEIDTGISGEIAQMVAVKFAKISANHQLIAITHLPQIAAMGDANYLIQKTSSDSKTVTDVYMLDETQKQTEIARLAGGSNIGSYGVLHAKELIDWCNRQKEGYRKR